MKTFSVILATLVATLCACASTAPPSAARPADVFFAELKSLCGKAYTGRVKVDTPPSPSSPFAGRAIIMHVRECSDDAIRIPLHVGDDRSRTWVLARTTRGLRLKHDHRHQDGSDDKLTMYGGDTAAAGSAIRQEFPVDAESIDLFKREGSAASITNTWAMVLVPGKTFVYELSRPGGRLFQVEFDLTKPVAPPPPPWGDE